jgi:hypothetical protein
LSEAWFRLNRLRRLCLSLLFAALCLMGAALVHAQQAAPKSPPTCDLAAIKGTMANRRFPYLIGCTVAQAREILGTRYGPLTFLPNPTAKAPPGIIIAQLPERDTLLDIAQGHVRLTVNVPAGVADGGQQTQTPPGEPASQPPQSYAVVDAPQVQEGESLIFSVKRARPAGMDIPLRYSVTGVGDAAIADRDFRQPSGDAVFPAGDLEMQIPVETLARPGANGPRQVQLALIDAPEDVQPVPPRGIGTIIDAPEVEVAAFSVLARSVQRGAPLSFTIRRTGPITGAYSVAYQTNEDDEGSATAVAMAADGTLPRITVPDGKDSATLAVSYDMRCARSVTITISDPQPTGTIAAASATAMIEGDPAPSCTAPPPPSFPWLYVFGGATAVVAIGVLAHRLATREKRQLRREEAITPPVLSCAIDPRDGDVVAANRPEISPADNDGIRVAIEDGALQPLNQPHVTRKESGDG